MPHQIIGEEIRMLETAEQIKVRRSRHQQFGGKISAEPIKDRRWIGARRQQTRYHRTLGALIDFVPGVAGWTGFTNRIGSAECFPRKMAPLASIAKPPACSPIVREASTQPAAQSPPRKKFSPEYAVQRSLARWLHRSTSLRRSWRSRVAGTDSRAFKTEEALVYVQCNKANGRYSSRASISRA